MTNTKPTCWKCGNAIDSYDGQIKLLLKDQVLILLHTNRGSYDGYQAAPALCQEGIATGLGIHQPQVVKQVLILIDEDLITETWAYVPGAQRQRKIYLPTQAGIIKAKKIVKSRKP